MTTEEPTDDDLFNEATGEEVASAATETEAPHEQETAGQSDSSASQATTQDGEQTQQTEARDQRTEDDAEDAKIPPWRLREINEEKRQLSERLKAKDAEEATLKAQLQEMQRRLAAVEKPKEAEESADDTPDPLLDPKAYAKHVRDSIKNELLNERREESMAEAHKKHGKDFEEAYSFAQQRIDPALKAKMQDSRDPGETLVQWYREQKTMQEVGSDPNAWLEKKLEERLSDPAFLAKAVERARGSASPQTQNGRPAVNLPPSLNGASRSNAALRSAANADVSDDQLFQELAG